MPYSISGLNTRITGAANGFWQPGPCNTVPSKFQLFGMDNVYATMLNNGSQISTFLIGPKSVAPGVAAASAFAACESPAADDPAAVPLPDAFAASLDVA